MEEERFVSGRENPRRIGFANCNSTNKSMPNEVAIQKPAAPILDRFKAMLKEREEELRVSAEDDVPPPTTEEIVRLYELLLSELTFNSKPIITDLTIIAGEQREHGEGIADAICDRIIEVAVDQKLPSLYLLDSIVKNIGREYVRHFSSRLPEVFCEAYRQVHPNQYQAMRHLFGTWSTVFPISVLHKIEAQLQFSPSVNQQSSGLTPLRASESPRPTLGIHVNPKYLEARHEFELSTKDSNIQRAKGSSSALNIYGQNHAIGYDGYDSDNTEVISSQVGAQILSSSDRAGRASFAPSTEKLPASSVAMLGRTSDPFRIGQSRTVSSPLEEFAVDNSPRRIAERVSPSYHGLENGLGRVIDRDEETSERWRNHWSDETNQRFEASTGYNYGNRVELQGPRALIDAYGNDRGKGIMSNKHLKVERLDINGIDSKLAPKTWQNTEEEEFDWEDMSPTLAGHNRSSDLLLSSNQPSGSFRTRPGLGRRNAASVETDFRRSSLSIPAQLPMVDDSSIALEDAVPTIGSGRGAIGKFTGPRNGVTQNMGSRYAHEGLNLPRYLQSSQHQLNAKGNGRNLHMPFPSGEQKALIDSYSDMNAQLHGPLTVGSRMGSSSLDSLNPEARSAAVTASTGAWPPVNMQTIHALPFLPSLPLQKQIRSQFDSTNSSSTFMNPSLNKSFLPEQQLNSVVNKVLSSAKLPQFPNEQAGSIPLNMQNPQVIPLQPQLIVSQGVRQNSVLPAAVPLPSPFVVPQMNHGYIPQGNAAAISTLLSNPVPGVHSSMPILNISNRSMQGGALPPLPPGPPPASSQMMQAISQNPGLVAPIAPVGSGFSGLFNSLMAQGLISLTNEASVQDSVRLDFNPDLLKVRHESVIRALYGDLPRQCSACGLRFKCQEEHSSHMDWHVTKNRVSKNRKQKASRKWFVSVEMWLSGAEALGTDAVPGFLPTENIVEKKDDEELAVPADEDQEVCALCGEHFDDFYSDETEEWMYKGAVYMNAPDGSTAGMDRSQLGPIVHAKCRSVSCGVSPEDFAQNEGGQTEEGNQRKRMRS